MGKYLAYFIDFSFNWSKIKTCQMCWSATKKQNIIILNCLIYLSKEFYVTGLLQTISE